MSAEKKKIVKRSKTNSVMELVASRLGVTPQELEREVSGKCKNVLNIAGLDKAVDLFWSMIDSPVYVYCDYDCDGITSGSIISIGCNSIGIKPHIIIPRRFTDGYGIYPAKMPPYETAFVFMKEDYQDIDVPPWAIRLILDEEDLESV